MFGKKKWKMISMYFSKIFTPKSAKECKDRWCTSLDPLAVKNTWSIMEEYIFFECQREFGNKWATIAKFLPGRYKVLTPEQTTISRITSIRPLERTFVVFRRRKTTLVY
jgi:hypothetical protein